MWRTGERSGTCTMWRIGNVVVPLSVGVWSLHVGQFISLPCAVLILFCVDSTGLQPKSRDLLLRSRLDWSLMTVLEQPTPTFFPFSVCPPGLNLRPSNGSVHVATNCGFTVLPHFTQPDRQTVFTSNQKNTPVFWIAVHEHRINTHSILRAKFSRMQICKPH